MRIRSADLTSFAPGATVYGLEEVLTRGGPARRSAWSGMREIAGRSPAISAVECVVPSL
jgi:hypothetical protein